MEREEVAVTGTAVSAFDRVFNVASRARQELLQSGNTDILLPTRRLFRRAHHRMSGTLGRRENQSWRVSLFLLPGPNYTNLPTPKRREKLTEIGFGRPVHETGKDGRSQINLKWTLGEFNQFIHQSYPQVSLNLVGFELARADKGRFLKKVQANSVKELKGATGRSRLYILPLAEVSQQISDMPPFIPEPVPTPLETNTAESLEDRRALQHQQDVEFNESLLEDKEKEMRRQELEAQERSRLMARETRRARISAFEEPTHGVPLKINFSNGLVMTRKFILSDSIQTLFDFAGQMEMASEVFSLREAGSGKAFESTLLGSIEDHNIQGFSAFHVQWRETAPVQEIVAGGPIGTCTELDQCGPAPSPPHWSPAPSPPHWSAAPSPPHWSAAPSPPHWSAAPSPPHWSAAPSPPHWSPAPSPPHWSPAPSPLSTQTQEDSKTDLTLETVLRELLKKVDFTSTQASQQINVCRDSILQGSLQAFKRRRFDPGAKLDVIFVDSEGTGEGAVDEGGPTREYLRLLMRAIQHSKIFDGSENDRLLALDTHALETGLYMLIGKMVTVCIIHGGVGPHFFSERLFLQLCGKSIPPATLDEVGDKSLKEKLLKIKEAETVNEANNAITDAEDSLSIMGALRYITSLEQRDSLVQSATDYFVDGRIHKALAQFEDGFKTLGFLDELRAHPEIFKDMFTSVPKPLQAKDLSVLFKVDFSATGSNKRCLENQSICFWRNWLIDVEEEECSPLTLEMVLEFASGASAVPPLGFPYRPAIEFLHDKDTKKFPEANTCALVLRLPIHKDYEKFKSCMTEGILQAPSFGIS